MFVISIPALKRNTAILREVKEAAGCQLVLALKGFSCWKAFPYLRDDLDGCCASGLWEALLARDYFQKQVLTYSVAYADADIPELCEFSHHLDFNSLPQWFRFREIVMAHPRFLSGELHCGLRINPECSTGGTPIYDPCIPGSRLGITAEQLDGADLTGLSGLHFHTLCEQDSDDLETTLTAVEEKFGHLLRLPQFIDLAQPLAPQYLVIGLTLGFTDLVVMFGYTALAARVLGALRSAAHMRLMNRAFGALFLAAGAFLALFKRGH